METLLGAITDKIKGEAKQLLATHVFTTLLNQLVFADMSAIQFKNPAQIGIDPNGHNFEDIHTMNGGDMFVSRTGGGVWIIVALSRNTANQ